MSRHLMIDLETMGLRPDAAIVSIGAVQFDEDTIYRQFHTAVSLASCTTFGLTTDRSTIDWWMKQSAEARSSWQRDDAPTLEDALAKFSHWIQDLIPEREVRPWGNGADFDLVILKSAYGAIGADPPWRYYNHRCFRTLKSLAPSIDVHRQGTHHNALDDALHQVAVLQAICKHAGFRLS
jgi:exodeoxyribonuclease VIII